MPAAADVVRRLPSGSRFADVRWLGEVDSTNRMVLGHARAGAAEGLVVIADFQTAGRGRRDRQWAAPAGEGLLMSILVRPLNLPVERRHLVTAAAGLAAREACAGVGLPLPDLKWPNDLLVRDRKLAGILAEAWNDAVVVGIGCNVSSAPTGAISAEEAAGRTVDRVELAAALLTALEARLGRWDEVAAEYRRTCATVGLMVRVETDDGDVIGRAEGVDELGRLVVDGQAFSVGDVVHLRPAE